MIFKLQGFGTMKVKLFVEINGEALYFETSYCEFSIQLLLI